MTYKKYIKYTFLLILFCFICIATINFILDPGKIYLQKILAEKQSKQFSEKLFNSKYGVVQEGWNERLVKTTLAKFAGQFDCVVLGSSHIKQISLVRNTGNINKQCKSLLNLGVSGGSLEDIAIFSYLILENLKLPNKVFIDIDPWTLKFGADSRYGAYKNYLNSINKYLKTNNQEYQSYKLKLLSNLFNGEYLFTGLKRQFDKDIQKNNDKKNMFEKKISIIEKSFDFIKGYNKAVTLPDGSHVYAKKWIAQQKKNNKNIKLGGGDYKIYGKVYDEKALKYLEKIIDLYRRNNIKVSFIVTPYHPNVFKKGNTKPVKHFTKMEEIINKFAKANNIKIYGSYFPNKVGCKGSEFFDFMHGTNQCLNKIDFSK